MKSKSKKSIKKIGNFLREVAVVVIGVAITLSVTVWINNRGEKRDIALYINAIKIELIENIQLLNDAINYYEDLYGYANYLKSHDVLSLHSDSIMKYFNSNLGNIHNVIFQTSAFEMFKNSGTMRLMNDKELIQTIWKAYLSMEEITLNLHLYNQDKSEAMSKDVQIFQEEGNFPSIPLYVFLTIYHHEGRLIFLKNASWNLKETLSKLEELKNKKPKKMSKKYK